MHKTFWVAFLAFNLLINLDFTRGVFVLYFVDHGISLLQVGILQTVLFLTNVATEIPTGIFADHYARKMSLILGGITLASAYFICFLTPTFSMLLIAFILKGIGFSFISGSDRALLYDQLLSESTKNIQKNYFKLSSTVNFLSTISVALAMIAGGYLFGSNWNIYLITAILFLFSIFAIMSLKENPQKIKLASSSKILKTKINDIKIFLKTKAGKNLLLFFLAISLFEGIGTPLFIYSQYIFEKISMPAQSISLILSVGLLINSFMYLFVKNLFNLKIKNVIFFCYMASFFIFVFIIISKSEITTIILLMSFNLIPNILFLFTDNHVNRNIKSNTRASLLSLQSFINSISIGFFYLIFGLLLNYNAKIYLFMSCILVIFLSYILILIYSKIRKKNNNSSKKPIKIILRDDCDIAFLEGQISFLKNSLIKFSASATPLVKKISHALRAGITKKDLKLLASNTKLNTIIQLLEKNKMVRASYTDHSFLTRQLEWLSHYTENPYQPQKRITHARVVIIGCGGTGSIIAEQLIRSGVENFLLIDGGRIDLPDLNRQFSYNSNNLGQYKTTELKKHLEKINNLSHVGIVNENVSDLSFILEHLIKFKANLLINCADKPPFLINIWATRCALKLNIPVAFAGAGLQDGTIGPLLTRSQAKIHYIKAMHIAKEIYAESNVPTSSITYTNCLIATILAFEIFKFISGLNCNLVNNKSVLFDFNNYKIQLERDWENPDDEPKKT